MSIDIIGKQIAAMRRERSIKQEELAKFVGVSTQAVSKWENGGVPDTELLPKIADFFSVSVDYLFGRNISDYSDMQTAISQYIIDTPKDQRFKAAFERCWDMERALFGRVADDGSIEDFQKKISSDKQHYSSIISNYGFTRMGITKKLEYFLLVPDIPSTEPALFEGIDYLTFFKEFSDKDVFDTCVFLYKRENKKAFTEKLLIKELALDQGKAKDVLKILKKYDLISHTHIEMDDETVTVYNFRPTPSFIALLIFAHEMIKTPNIFSYYGADREKPFLN